MFSSCCDPKRTSGTVSPMDSRRRKLITVSLIALVGFFVGMYLAWVEASQGPRVEGPSLGDTSEYDPSAKKTQAGWCCLSQGQRCSPAEDAKNCLTDQDGRFFVVDRNKCDSSCQR